MDEGNNNPTVPTTAPEPLDADGAVRTQQPQLVLHGTAEGALIYPSFDRLGFWNLANLAGFSGSEAGHDAAYTPGTSIYAAAGCESVTSAWLDG